MDAEHTARRDGIALRMTQLRRGSSVPPITRKRYQDSAAYFEALRNLQMDTFSLKTGLDDAMMFYEPIEPLIELQSQFSQDAAHIVDDMLSVNPTWFDPYWKHSSQILKNNADLVELSQYYPLGPGPFTNNEVYDRCTFLPWYDDFRKKDAGMCAWGWKCADQDVSDKYWYGKEDGRDGLAAICDGEPLDTVYVSFDSRNFMRVIFNSESGHKDALVMAMLVHATSDEMRLMRDNLAGMGVEVREARQLRARAPVARVAAAHLC